MTSIRIPRLRISNSLTKNFPKDFFIGRKEVPHPVSPNGKINCNSRENVVSLRKFKPIKLNSKLMRIPSTEVKQNLKSKRFLTAQEYVELDSIVNIINSKVFQRQVRSNQKGKMDM